MRRRLYLGFGLLVRMALGSESVHALDLKVEEQLNRIKLDVFSEAAYFKGRKADLMGWGFGSGARYAVYDRWQVGLKMGQALTYDGGLAALYTSFASQLTFAILGSFIVERRTIYVDGKQLARSEPAKRSLLTVGVGFDQFLFNGTQFAIPSTGLSIHFGYQFPLWGFDWYVNGRIGGLVLSKTVIVPIIGNLGPVWTF